MLRYRLSTTDDPEERLEDAALWKGLHDVFGDEVSLYADPPRRAPAPEDDRIAETLKSIVSDDEDDLSTLLLQRAERLQHPELSPLHVLAENDILLGRQRRDEHRWPTKRLCAPFLPYWEDHAFIAAADRFFEVHDFRGAIDTARALHAQGKGAFLKSTRTKHWIGRVPVGLDPMEVMEDMAYSFADLENCLMVQELVPMEYEMRFAVMDRQIVSGAPVAYWMTPLDHELAKEHVARTPSSRELEWNPGMIARLRSFAEAVAKTLESPDCILDVCWSNGRPIAIELNAMAVGAFGLYGMNVHDIARGVRDILLPRHQAGVSAAMRR